MKSKIFRIFTLVLCLSLLLYVPAMASGDLAFGTQDGYAFIDECSLYAVGKVIVPSSYNGYPVTTMAPYAFMDCKQIAEIVLPDGFEKIECGAFDRCTALKTINIPDSVTEIEFAAFRDCTSLQSISIPDSVTSMSGHVFSGCSSLSVANIPAGVDEIGFELFKNCTSLKEITIPANVEWIWDQAFYGCTGLQTVRFEGNAPFFGLDIFASDEGAGTVTVTAYYPADNDTWDEEVFDDFGGKVTWVPYGDDKVEGDVSGDGKVNMADVAKIFAHVRKKKVITDSEILLIADMNGDGKINMGDVSMLFKAVRAV